MNKWERETFLPKLKAKPMTEKEYSKIARKYDYKKHDKTRLVFNEIDSTVQTVNKVQEIAKNAPLEIKLQCPTVEKMSSTKWSRNSFLAELKSGPMSDARFDEIMNSKGASHARKFINEYNTQRKVANTIWEKADCNKLAEVKTKTAKSKKKVH